MKKLVWAMLIGVVVSLTAPLTATAASLNNFTITNYDIQYRLAKDADNRSTLLTTETITANFPANQNHGIERAVPTDYDGHPVSLDVISVKDQSDSDLKYSIYSSNRNRVIRIGDPNRYVSGQQTYVITYQQRDVTKSFADRDEFYWDTNGTDWRVPIQNLSVSLELDDSVADAYIDQAMCYQGRQGSDQTCQLDRDGQQFSVQARNLSSGENISLALGFEPETFAKYQLSLWAIILIIWLAVQGILVAVSFGLIIWLSIRFHARKQRKSEHDPIVPEYLPPADSSIEVSARLLGLSYKSFPAQIIDLAVRHYLQISEVKPKKFLKPAEYQLEIVKSTTDLRAEEQEFVKDLFSDKVAVGSKLNMKTLQNNTVVYMNFQDNPKKTRALVRGEYALRAQVPAESAWFRRASLWLLVSGIVLLSPPLLVVALIAFIQSKVLWPLTDKGLALLRYLKGLKMYIEVAEAERLKMLQSPEGAAKVGQSDSPAKLVKLYERVLPYAVLFGQEKDWNKQLGSYYESAGTQPDWYSGYNGAAFSSAAFSSAMSSFNSTTRYSSQSSSSSSGSSGGGFSGGGGGGGGGGGW